MNRKRFLSIFLILILLISVFSYNFVLAESQDEQTEKSETLNEKSEGTNIEGKVDNNNDTKSKEIKSQTRVIEDGLYKIFSSIEDNRLIESPNRSRNNKTYLKLGKDEDLASQKFQITYNESDNTYTIKLLSSLKAMDVKDGDAKNKVKVWQYNSNNTDAQKWYIEKNSDGTYTFRSKINKNYCLDVSGGESDIGTSIQIYKSNSTNSQKFKLEECSNIKASQTIKDGTYKILSNANNNMVLNLNNKMINLQKNGTQTSQKFEIKYLNDGYYNICIPNTNNVITAKESSVTVAENQNLDSQKWIIKKQGSAYVIISKTNNKCADLTNGETSAGTKLQLFRDNATAAQEFIFVNIDQHVENGLYKIYSTLKDNRLIESPDRKRTNKTYLKLGEDENLASQKFQIQFNETDGTYSVKLLSSLKAMDVKDGDAKNKVKVWQYNSNSTDAQKWYIEENSDGTYKFRSKLDRNYCLDVSGGKSDIGTSIQVYKSNSTASQKFRLEECSNIKASQTIEDGTYRIISRADQDKSLTLNSDKIELQDDELTDMQKFEIKYVDNGFYNIIIPNTNKVLTADGTSIKVSENNNLDSQKWIIRKQGSYYNFISINSNYCADLTGGETTNGTKLQLFRDNATTAQEFRLINLTPKENIVTDIEDGIYQISLKNNKVIDVSHASYENKGNIQTWDNDKVQQQKFRITHIQGTDYYMINAIHSAKAMDVSNGDCKSGTNVWQYSINNTTSQYWYFKENDDGYYNIISVRNGLYLDVSGGLEDEDGQNIQVYFGNTTDAQKFKFEKIDIIKDGTYEIETKLKSDIVLDVDSASKDEMANIQIWESTNVKQQKFILESLSNEEYSIKAKHSNKALTVDENNNLVQKTYSGDSNQIWIIKEAGNGYYNLISKSNGYAITVENGKTNNGTNVNLKVKDKSNSQAFKFFSGFRTYYEEGTYGTSGLSKKGDKRGTSLKYYKFGKGDKVFFATFSIHGFEDSYAHDGKELTYIANEFKDYLKENDTGSLLSEWTIYIFPNLNPDGQTYGTTNNGPGRTTLYSSAPNHKGIDMNRNFSTGFTKNTTNRNYTGTKAFQAYEAKALREFLLDHQGKENVLVDLHGWLNETIGNDQIGKYYRNEFGMTKHIKTYGNGYLVNWARTEMKNTKSALIELPEVTKHSQIISKKYPEKYINATIDMLNGI